eukprot:1359559-Pyramimonas_sp.AAC.1
MRTGAVASTRRREEGGGQNIAFNYQHFPGVVFCCRPQILTYMLLLPVLCTHELRHCGVHRSCGARKSSGVHRRCVAHGCCGDMDAAVYTFAVVCTGAV